MMIVTREEGARPIKAWLGTKEVLDYGEDALGPQYVGQEPSPRRVLDIEDAARKQLKNLARLPFIAPQGIAVMPDAHLGKGATVGSVVPTIKAVIPAAVGVDIGCGMNAVKLSLTASQLPTSLKAVRERIEELVPTGNAGHKDIHGSFQRIAVAGASAENKLVAESIIATIFNGSITKFRDKAGKQLGSLGSGNHFIELCVEVDARNSKGDLIDPPVWVMLHSGSRGIGNMIGQYYIDKAKERMEQYHIKLDDKDLAYLPEGDPLHNDYIEAVRWAQDYALENRRVMMDVVLQALRDTLPVPFTVTSEAVNCHHNYIDRESHFGQNIWVTRKGAIRARAGDLGIIPGSMGQKSYIVRGKGNPESYCSCSHGAGRAMSRAEAKRRFSITDLEAQTAGVECRKDEDVIDEIPGSYKRLDVVMALQQDLVEVVHTLKAVLCVKGN